MINSPVKIVKLHPDAVVPEYARPLDAGFDLVAIEDYLVYPGEQVKVRTGLGFQLLPGFELQIRDRSGIASKTKLRVSNAPGTVDAGYRGEVNVLIDNISQMSLSDIAEKPHVWSTGVNVSGAKVDRGVYIIKKGDRIAQGVIAIVACADFIVVDKLDESERGGAGFGSTGTRI